MVDLITLLVYCDAMFVCSITVFCIPCPNYKCTQDYIQVDEKVRCQTLISLHVAARVHLILYVVMEMLLSFVQSFSFPIKFA